MNNSPNTSNVREQTPDPVSKLKRIVQTIAYQLTIVVGILVAIELALTVYGTQKLDSLVEAEDDPSLAYPARPDDFVKIATFGGSAAAGAYSPRAFFDVIRYRLQDRFPEKKIYVRNYAEHGYPFHRHQAEYVKRLIDKYDFVIIYAGNNEAENWYDDSGYWRIPEYKAAKDLKFVPPPGDYAPQFAGLKKWLAKHSRMFAIATRARQSQEPPVTKNRNRNYREFEEEPSLPDDQRLAIAANFQQDIREICELAKEQGTQVLLAASASYETWPPSFSVFRSTISKEEQQRWHEHYQRGKSAFERSEFEQAVAAFQEAEKLDRDVAIMNYHMGMSLLRLGDESLGRSYLRRAIDHEGHYFRSTSPLHDASRKLAEDYECLHYVDIEAAFHEALAGQEITDSDLFVDVCHPSFFGHVIMGEVFLRQLLQLEPMKTWPSEVPASISWRQLSDQLYRQLEVRPSDEAEAIAGNILWYFDLENFSAYPDRCLSEVKVLLTRMQDRCENDPMATTFSAVARARLAVREHDLDLAVEELNRALAASARHLDVILDLKAWNHYIDDEFVDVGITYSREKKVFTKTP